MFFRLMRRINCCLLYWVRTKHSKFKGLVPSVALNRRCGPQAAKHFASQRTADPKQQQREVRASEYRMVSGIQAVSSVASGLRDRYRPVLVV